MELFGFLVILFLQKTVNADAIAIAVADAGAEADGDPDADGTARSGHILQNVASNIKHFFNRNRNKKVPKRKPAAQTEIRFVAVPVAVPVSPSLELEPGPPYGVPAPSNAAYVLPSQPEIVYGAPIQANTALRPPSKPQRRPSYSPSPRPQIRPKPTTKKPSYKHTYTQSRCSKDILDSSSSPPIFFSV